MDRQTLIANLSTKFLDDDSFDRVKRFYPLAEICPTCQGERSYRLGGEVHDCDCEVQRLLQRHYFAANIGREYHDICLKDFVGPDRDYVVPLVERYLERFNDNFHYGLGLTFTGPIGTGKTFAMSAILKELIKRKRSAYFITFDQFVAAWGKSYMDEDQQSLLERLMSVEVLGLDELKTDGRNRGGFLSNGLETIIRHRTSNLLPTLVTTNLMPDQEEAHFSKAFSLLSARNEYVIFAAEDARPSHVHDTIHELRDASERRPIC